MLFLALKHYNIGPIYVLTLIDRELNSLSSCVKNKPMR